MLRSLNLSWPSSTTQLKRLTSSKLVKSKIRCQKSNDDGERFCDKNHKSMGNYKLDRNGLTMRSS